MYWSKYWLYLSGIFFDTYGEHYEDLREFHQHLPVLLKPGGIYSFFNGLCGGNAFFHVVYCNLVSLELENLGYHTQLIPLPVKDCLGEKVWEGVRQKYWQLDTYYLPFCQSVQDSEWCSNCATTFLLFKILIKDNELYLVILYLWNFNYSSSDEYGWVGCLKELVWLFSALDVGLFSIVICAVLEKNINLNILVRWYLKSNFILILTCLVMNMLKELNNLFKLFFFSNI